MHTDSELTNKTYKSSLKRIETNADEHAVSSTNDIARSLLNLEEKNNVVEKFTIE